MTDSDDFAKPVIKKDPQSQIALRDGILNFTCVAVSSSSSQITIEWKKDHVVTFALICLLKDSNLVDCNSTLGSLRFKKMLQFASVASVVSEYAH